MIGGSACDAHNCHSRHVCDAAWLLHRCAGGWRLSSCAWSWGCGCALSPASMPGKQSLGCTLECTFSSDQSSDPPEEWVMSLTMNSSSPATVETPRPTACGAAWRAGDSGACAACSVPLPELNGSDWAPSILSGYSTQQMQCLQATLCLLTGSECHQPATNGNTFCACHIALCASFWEQVRRMQACCVWACQLAPQHCGPHTRFVSSRLVASLAS